MDYERIYNILIERARGRKEKFSGEIHHIVPRSMGGGDNFENLVLLTYREHFICHLLLLKIYKGTVFERKLAFACQLMSTGCEGRMTNRLYGWVRNYLHSSPMSKEHRKNISEALKSKGIKPPGGGWPKGSKHTEESRRKMSESKSGNPLGDSHKESISKSLKGKRKSEIHKESMSKARIGKKTGPITEERRRNISESRLKTKKIKCPYCSKECAPNLIYRFHFENCKQKTGQ